MARPSRDDVLRLGQDVAQAKANMGRKRWSKFVKIAHARGHTVRSELDTSLPGPLKERTDSSIRDEAQRTVGDAYKPVMQELDRRALAQKYRDDADAAAEANYRTWLQGESDKLDAQARAADATLAAQQSQIATDLNAAQKAGAADSMQRMAQTAGNVSDPAQSTALTTDRAAADQRSRELVANARGHTAEVMKIGSNAGSVSRAAVIATAAVREATRVAESYKSQAQINADRSQALTGQAKDTADLLRQMRAGEVDKAQRNREFGLAQGELGVKAQGIEADAQAAKDKLKLESKKFDLDKWKAEHADEVDRLKVQMGYDRIKASQGQAAADRALRKQIADQAHRDRVAARNDKEHGVSKDERKLYQDTETARGLIARWHQKGKNPLSLRQHLRNMGVSDPMIDVANDLWRNHGKLSPAGVAKAHALGILHAGYFWDV